jgi:acetyltransferase-like isoleucine patch superfamily enzyme
VYAIFNQVSAPLPIGADAVVPPRVRRTLSRLRLARLRLSARGRLESSPGVTVGRGARVLVAPGGSVRLGEGCSLGPGCRVESAGGAIEIGAGARLGERAVIVALERVTLGEDAVLGDWAIVSDTEEPRPAADVETPLREQPVVTRPVCIGSRARVGAHAGLSAGAAVADGAAVASYAVLSTRAAGR